MKEKVRERERTEREHREHGESQGEKERRPKYLKDLCLIHLQPSTLNTGTLSTGTLTV